MMRDSGYEDAYIPFLINPLGLLFYSMFSSDLSPFFDMFCVIIIGGSIGLLVGNAAWYAIGLSLRSYTAK